MIYWGGEFDFSLLENELKKLKTESEKPDIWKESNAKSIFQKYNFNEWAKQYKNLRKKCWIF